MVFQRSGANEPNLLGMQVEDQGSRYGGIVLNGVNGIGVVRPDRMHHFRLRGAKSTVADSQPALRFKGRDRMRSISARSLDGICRRLAK